MLMLSERDQLRGASTSWRDLLADLFESVAIWEWQQRQQRWYDANGMAAPWQNVGLRNQRWQWPQPQTQFLGP